jgi:hypothetical protein
MHPEFTAILVGFTAGAILGVYFASDLAPHMLYSWVAGRLSGSYASPDSSTLDKILASFQS